MIKCQQVITVKQIKMVTKTFRLIIIKKYSFRVIQI